MKERVFNRALFVAAFGTVIEYYDYAVLVTFLPLISPLFFPAATAYDSLVKGFYAMLVAAAARPLGGLLFGYLGDTFGRRRALLSSMYGIAFATILMGIAPTYAEIGIWAGVLITAMKAVQLFCFGGEYNGAGIYVVEHAKKNHEALTGSFLTAMMLVGSLLAMLICYLSTLDGMPSWIWRAAFIFGGLMGIVGIMWRKNLAESPHFKEADKEAHSLKALFKGYPLQLTAGLFIGGFATAPFTTVIGFINPVLLTKGVLSSQKVMLLQCFLIAVAVVTLVIAGRLADRKSPWAVMRLGAISLALFSFPLLLLADQGALWGIISCELLLIIFNELLLGPSNACLKNLFPMQFRYRAASISFTLGLSIVGGLTPVVENYLYQLTGSFAAIALWLSFIGLAAFFSLRAALRAPLLGPKERGELGEEFVK